MSRALVESVAALALCSCAARPTNGPATSNATQRANAAHSQVALTAAREMGRETLGVPAISNVAVEIVEPAPTSLANARFELVHTDATTRFVDPVRDGDDRTAPTEQHRTPSFIVDYDRDPLHSRCESPANERTGEAILRRTDQWISRKSMAIGFVTASVVFDRREGDCTEHAVLAAALLRCNAIPARLASGYAVVRVDNAVAAIGHMWTERFDDGWRVTDAALTVAGDDVVRLRVETMEREGVDAFDGDRIDELLQIARIRVHRR